MIGSVEAELMKLKEFLANNSRLKTWEYFLSMEVARSKKEIAISQREYVLDLLKETRLLGCKPISTPIDPNHNLDKSEKSASVDKVRYQKHVGKLIYLAHIQLNISFAVGIVCQFMHCPTDDHLKAMYRILHYLKSSSGEGILFSKTHNR